MKPFDLEAAKAGALCVTSYGHKAELVYSNLHGRKPLLFVITVDDITTIVTAKSNGLFVSNNRSIGTGIFMARVTHAIWMNIYPSSSHPNRFYEIYKTEREANESAGSDRIKCEYIEWEE